MGCVFDQLLGLILDYHWAMSLLVFFHVVGNRMGSFDLVLAAYSDNGDDILARDVRLPSILCIYQYISSQPSGCDW